MIVFFFSVFSCLVVVPYLLFHFQPLTIRQFLMLVGAGVAATGGQFGATLAYTHAPAREVRCMTILSCSLPPSWDTSSLTRCRITGA